MIEEMGAGCGQGVAHRNEACIAGSRDYRSTSTSWNIMLTTCIPSTFLDRSILVDRVLRSTFTPHSEASYILLEPPDPPPTPR
jgi:hypothetical protein